MLGIYSHWSNCGLGYMAEDFYNILKDKYDIVGLNRPADNHEQMGYDFVENENDINIYHWIKKHKIRNLLIFQFLNCKYVQLRRIYPSKMSLIPMGEFVEEEFLHNLYYFNQILPISFNTFSGLHAMCQSGMLNLQEGFHEKIKYFYYIPKIEDFLEHKVKFKDDITLLMDVGRGGMWDRRNINYCLTAFRQAAEHRDDIKLVFKTQRDFEYYDMFTRDLLEHPQIELVCKDATRKELGKIRSKCQLNLTAQGFGEPDLVHFETLAMGMPQMVMGYPLFKEFTPDISIKFRGWKQIPMPNGLSFKTHPDLNDLKDKIQNLDITDLKEKSKDCKGWVKDRRELCKEAIRVLI